MASYHIEESPSNRAKCRGCERIIAKGTLRFGETMMNPRADAETTFWYHPECAAYKRPEAMIAYLDQGGEVAESDRLRKVADIGVAHPRVARLHRAHVSPSARATCRACRELIEKDVWRISVVFFEDGYLNPAGYVHAGCVEAYAETTESAMERIRHFNLDLTDAEVGEIDAEISSGRAAPEA